MEYPNNVEAVETFLKRSRNFYGYMTEEELDSVDAVQRTSFYKSMSDFSGDNEINKTKARAVLQRARYLIGAEPHWTKGRYAADRDGVETALLGHKAYCYCVEGAIIRAAHDLIASKWECAQIENYLFDQISQVVKNDVTIWNDEDETTHAEVMRVLSEVQKELQKE